MRWEELTSPEIDVLDRDRTVVILPIGSVEQHGQHMPMGTDSYLAHGVCLATAERATGGEIAVLPPPWYGFSRHHMRFAGSITLSADTLMRLVGDIVDSIIQHGFRRVILVNGHGGNVGVVDVLASTIGARHYGKTRFAGVNYWQLAADAIREIRRSKPGGTGHACEFETAVMLHLYRELVKMERAVTLYPDTGSSYLSTDLFGGSKVRTYLDFKDLSSSGTLGDPSLATAEQGKRFLDACVGALAAFIGEFRTWPVETTT
jgi:creatinine amidohydrolase